jgi:hypothetical protein
VKLVVKEANKELPDSIARKASDDRRKKHMNTCKIKIIDYHKYQ